MNFLISNHFSKWEIVSGWLQQLYRDYCYTIVYHWRYKVIRILALQVVIRMYKAISCAHFNTQSRGITRDESECPNINRTQKFNYENITSCRSWSWIPATPMNRVCIPQSISWLTYSVHIIVYCWIVHKIGRSSWSMKNQKKLQNHRHKRTSSLCYFPAVFCNWTNNGSFGTGCKLFGLTHFCTVFFFSIWK